MQDNQTQSLYKHARTRIPGGVQLLSKRPENFAPGQWPAYFSRARGCEVWDLDGNSYIDMSLNGIGACLLGFAHPGVTEAVTERIARGSMCTLNAPEEVELADRLCALHPWAEQVRFGRTGGEACAMAARIARATTGRDVIAICGYHGWQDWYLAANLGESDALKGHLLPGLSPEGVPAGLRGTTVAFMANDIPALDAILAEHGDRLAAIVMEPCRYHDPEPGFLEAVRAGCTKVGALLVFDEITIGWRLCFGGAHLKHGVLPDLAVFAKALGNGHPISAIIGTRAAMDGAHQSFISSTYWTESVGPTAALAVLDAMAAENIPDHIAAIGTSMQQHWRDAAERHGVPVAVHDGYPCLAHFAFEHSEANALKTLYIQEMLKLGYLAGPVIYPTLAHTDAIVEKHAEAMDTVFGKIAQSIAADRIHDDLEGPEAHTGFRRLL
jgi:glutamate-1-semialdehyde 2,1-aminomutase